MKAHTGTGADLLATIVAATARVIEVRKQYVSAEELEARGRASNRGENGFLEALSRLDRLNVIAECKRRSPSRGVLRAEYDPAAIARGYAEHGAAAISVLTEPTFFDGDPDHLRDVRAQVTVPLLRKDFVVDEYQLLEARAFGADAVLLIVAALAPASLRSLLRAARSLGLAALVEVHDEQELEVAVACGAPAIGVNNRNLRTLEVSIDASERLIRDVPDDCVAVAESGLKSHDDLVRLHSLGYDAFLVGERLMTSEDPGAALGELLSPAIGRQPSSLATTRP